MTAETHQFAQSRAARMLDQAIRHHTAHNRGGLRALASALGMKQATVLSAMATGRMAIPLDRAPELATELGLDVAQFCLAVLEQRAPGVHHALDEAFGVSKFGDLTTEQREIVRAAIDAKAITGEHVSVVGEVIHARKPRERWLAPFETPIIRLVRERYPEGIPLAEMQPLLNGFAALLEA